MIMTVNSSNLYLMSQTIYYYYAELWWAVVACFIELLVLMSSGTTCGSCRSGWRTGSWPTAAPRKPWSRWDKLPSCCRSTRRPRPTLKQFALCALPSTRHRCATRPTLCHPEHTFACVSLHFDRHFHFGLRRLLKCWRCTHQWSSLKSECRLLSSQLLK